MYDYTPEGKAECEAAVSCLEHSSTCLTGATAILVTIGVVVLFVILIAVVSLAQYTKYKKRRALFGDPDRAIFAFR